MGQFGSAPQQPMNSTQTLGSKQVPYLVAYNGAWYGMLGLAGTLLTLCALLAGLTLAVCGLNMTFLHIRSVTGTPGQRKHALVVTQMKRHHSWMLCSLILSSVFCGESLPFVIQSLWNDPKQWWVPIIVSTLSIAFFAEIAPQYWVPRRAIEWGLYCWPLIWGCMWITCIVSWPLAKILDYCSGGKDEVSVFSNDDLAGLIQYHERSEKHGGSLDGDTCRVMLGALRLDGHSIGAKFSPLPESRSADSSEKGGDLEKADLTVAYGMIVNWSAVKTVDIDEPVDKAFILKVKSFSYSRIPVTGEAQTDQASSGHSASLTWDARKIFGVLHVKNLVGLKIPDRHDTKSIRLRVRDLQLYPLPIVTDDMPAYSILSMFNSGISRMAIVISTPERTSISQIVIPKRASKPIQSQAPCWTGTERTKCRINSRLKKMNKLPNDKEDFLDGALAGIGSKRHNVVGIRCPMPLGIVTFEDVIGTILQKTSRDEREFYDHCDPYRAKIKKMGDCGTVSTLRQMVLHPMSESITIPNDILERHSSVLVSKDHNILRKRNLSNKATAAMDGTDERGADRVNERRRDYTASSYTLNSQGGFHGAESSLERNSMAPISQAAPEKPTFSGKVLPSTRVYPDSSPKAASSLPSRKEASPFLFGEFDPSTRRYVSATPNLPTLRRVTPFSRVECSSFDENLDAEEEVETMAKHGQIDLIMPRPAMLNERFGADVSGIDISDTGLDFSNSLLGARVELDAESHTQEDSDGTISVNSWCYRDPYEHGLDNPNSGGYSKAFLASPLANVQRNETPPAEQLNCVDISKVLHIRDSPDSPERKIGADVNGTYKGFPAELLDKDSENRVPDFASMTLPRTIGMGGLDDRDNFGGIPHLRDWSFADDRALLPSQRRALYGSADMMLGSQRRTSFYF